MPPLLNHGGTADNAMTGSAEKDASMHIMNKQAANKIVQDMTSFSKNLDTEMVGTMQNGIVTKGIMKRAFRLGKKGASTK